MSMAPQDRLSGRLSPASQSVLTVAVPACLLVLCRETLTSVTHEKFQRWPHAVATPTPWQAPSPANVRVGFTHPGFGGKCTTFLAAGRRDTAGVSFSVTCFQVARFQDYPGRY